MSAAVLYRPPSACGRPSARKRGRRAATTATASRFPCRPATRARTGTHPIWSTSLTAETSPTGPRPAPAPARPASAGQTAVEGSAPAAPRGKSAMPWHAARRRAARRTARDVRAGQIQSVAVRAAIARPGKPATARDVASARDSIAGTTGFARRIPTIRHRRHRTTTGVAPLCRAATAVAQASSAALGSSGRSMRAAVETRHRARAGPIRAVTAGIGSSTRR